MALEEDEELLIISSYRVRNFRGRVSYFNQSEARKHCFLAYDWLKCETLPRKFSTPSKLEKNCVRSSRVLTFDLRLPF